jgi:hypothetical protein
VLGLPSAPKLELDDDGCREDVRTANIIAADPKGVDCLVIDRE